MKKLRLQPESLSVEPFETTAPEKARGTVMGADASSLINCTGPDASCGYPYTCGGTSCPTGYPLCRACAA
jgi:hypothetical protein